MRAWLAIWLALWAAPAMALDCRVLEFEGSRFSVCDVDMNRDALRIFLRDGEGAIYGQFHKLAGGLEATGARLGFAMNAGMYHEDRSPVGLYVENGEEQHRIVTSAGPGNFGLLPNGVFCIRPGRADVIETLSYRRQKPACDYATQSGPMLVIDGKLHPRFLADSTSRYIRNGVGTSADGEHAVFAISDSAVTFHQFGRFFRDGLKLPQALYLDGSVSKLYAPSLNRADLGRDMGPIVGVIEQQ